MLNRLTNALRGKVRLEVEGAFPERLLNLCAQRGILFWNVEWLEATRLRFTVTRQGAGAAIELGERAMCTVTRAGQAGLLVFLERFRRRYALLIGLALSLTAVCVLSQFVLTIQVEGNQTVPTAVILTELRRQGLRPGVFGPGLDEKTIRTKALLQLPELSWMSVNLYGTRAQVLVREATPEPEVVDETATGSVVARASGIITRMDTLNGEALVDVGDTVVTGETLISGTVHLDAPKYSELPDLGTLQVRAEGRVYARTWRTLVGELPLESPVKVYTGEEKTCWSATVLGQRFVFFGNSGIPFSKYDKISKVWELTLPGGQAMPLTVQRETHRAYETAAAALDPDAARQMLEEQLLEELKQAVGTGEVVSTDYTAVQEDGLLRVTLQAECTEEIGRFVPDENTQEKEADS